MTKRIKLIVRRKISFNFKQICHVTKARVMAVRWIGRIPLGNASNTTLPRCNFSSRCVYDSSERSWKKYDDETSSSLMIPLPRNCQDIKILGHSINGLYIVKKSDGNEFQFGNISCDFSSQKISKTLESQSKLSLPCMMKNI